MSYDGLFQRSPDAVKLLHLAVFLSPGSIPSIFENRIELGVPDFTFEIPASRAGIVEMQSFGLLCWLDKLRGEFGELGAAVGELESSGFVKLGRNQNNAAVESLAVHSLVRAFICSKASEENIHESLATTFFLGGKSLRYGTKGFRLTELWKHTGELRRLLVEFLSSVPTPFFQGPDGQYFVLCGAVAPVYAYTCRLLGDLEGSSRFWDIAIKYRVIAETAWPDTELHMDEIFEAARIDVKVGSFGRGIERYELFLAHCDQVFPDNDERAVQAAAALREARETFRNIEHNFGRAIVAQRVTKQRPVEPTLGEAISSLHKATKNGDIEEVRLLLEAGADIAAPDEGWTPLHIASRYGHVNIVLLLLKRKVEINPTDNRGCTPLHLASAHGCSQEASLLLEHGAEVEHENFQGETALICAAQSGHELIVRYLLQHGANLDIQDFGGSTALSRASGRGYDTIVEVLLEHNPNLDLQNSTGRTALAETVHAKKEKISFMLIGHGADPNIQDQNGCTALHWAVGYGLSKTVIMLLENNADPNMQNGKGQTPLITMVALLRHGTAIPLLLLYHGADPNIQDKEGFFALYWAAENGMHDTILVLLENGADPNLQNGQGRSPLMVSVMNPFNDAANSLMLIKYGADPNMQSAGGFFALFFAVYYDRNDLILMLLENGADPNLQADSGLTALMRAALSEHEAAVSLLLQYNARIDIMDSLGITVEACACLNQSILRLLSEARASSLTLQSSDRTKSLAESTEILSQNDHESHQTQEYDEQKREPKDVGGMLEGLREQRRETTRTMGEAWKRLTKRPWKGKGRMERKNGYDFSQADDDGDSTHHS
ncbi:hypothetical protein N7509_004016 [Penicillium cosmopolitanum]|uniref:Prion-inhibition and propagation HeLo domain-containing protein n=1 Tax=Penicillium cosmopolitanum TaxID=1131564 RepID=A0A9W9W640_9EURO|nr:uncharacterized protein N7509_004016 [Penicillium cosmopolitanum]KAJ5404145.1 hypothetical protein N7509_004016 [Penicillium cosmopolitanum]